LADYDIPEILRFTEDDEWVRDDGDCVVVGVTDYAQSRLGDIVFVELPEVGSPVVKGETFGVIESVKAVSDLYSPVTGEVVAVNDILDESPETVNEDCYGDGWIIAVGEADPDDLDSLLDADAYRGHIEARGD
jgi:glycine cleavage system H protein